RLVVGSPRRGDRRLLSPRRGAGRRSVRGAGAAAVQPAAGAAAAARAGAGAAEPPVAAAGRYRARRDDRPRCGGRALPASVRPVPDAAGAVPPRTRARLPARPVQPPVPEPGRHADVSAAAGAALPLSAAAPAALGAARQPAAQDAPWRWRRGRAHAGRPRVSGSDQASIADARLGARAGAKTAPARARGAMGFLPSLAGFLGDLTRYAGRDAVSAGVLVAVGALVDSFGLVLLIPLLGVVAPS